MALHKKHALHTARNAIWTESAKSIVVVLLIAALATWQFDFAYKAVLSHPQLNLLIIFTFIGGCISAFVTLYRLRNEVNALTAMQEAQNDFAEMEKSGDDGGVTRLVRAAEPAVVLRH